MGAISLSPIEEDEPGNMANLAAGSSGALRHDLVTLHITEKITDVNY